jgi:predicted glycosyltransferase
MRYLFDILHPAHVHVLKHTMTELRDRDHDVVVTARDKDVALDLLDAYDIDYTVLSSQQYGSVNLARELVSRTVKLGKFARSQNVDALVGLMGPSIAPVGRILRIPSYVLYDTEIAKRTNTWVYPMATEVITPGCYTGRVHGNHVTYAGYHELAYLHPDRFTPDPAKLAMYGLDTDHPYVVLRLPSLLSSHDNREVDTPSETWLRWISATRETRRVVISSERPLGTDLDAFRLEGPPVDVHHVLAHADLVMGESATMAAEAAVLGTTAILVGATSRGYIDDIESRYGLIRYFTPDRIDDALDTARVVLDSPDSAAVTEAHSELIDAHIDVTSWLTDHLLTASTNRKRP